MPEKGIIVGIYYATIRAVLGLHVPDAESKSVTLLLAIESSNRCSRSVSRAAEPLNCYHFLPVFQYPTSCLPNRVIFHTRSSALAETKVNANEGAGRLILYHVETGLSKRFLHSDRKRSYF
jgi:hypothetical protein